MNIQRRVSLSGNTQIVLIKKNSMEIDRYIKITYSAMIFTKMPIKLQNFYKTTPNITDYTIGLMIESKESNDAINNFSSLFIESFDKFHSDLDILTGFIFGIGIL